jgi:hypothetical protein
MGRPDGAILRAIVAEALFFRPRQLALLSTCTTAPLCPISCIDLAVPEGAAWRFFVFRMFPDLT